MIKESSNTNDVARLYRVKTRPNGVRAYYAINLDE